MRGLFNLNLWWPLAEECEGSFPALKPQSMPDIECWTTFSEKSKISKRTGLHFFIEDYRFESVWTYPTRYLNLLRGAAVVLTPDFSQYRDMAVVLQQYNHFRQQWLGAWWQMQGVNVIPTICWSDEASFAWCFDGVPHGSPVAVSSVGTQARKDEKAAFMLGYDAMRERLQPSMILFYGAVPKEARGNIVHVDPFYKKFK